MSPVLAPRRASSPASLVVPLVVLAAALPRPARGQEPGATGAAPFPADTVATFSILGYDPETGEVGGAVQSRVFSVGNGVLWAEAGVGVAATQAVVDVSYGPRSLELLEAGLTPEAVVDAVYASDPDPRPESWPKAGRQFAVMDAGGEVAAFTGPEAPEWSGHRTAIHVSAQGNILAGPEVVDEMVRAFGETEGHLSFRLLAALEAGQAAGGDRRGKQSAAMVIVKEDGGWWLNHDTVLRLQVDDSPEPIAELRRLVEKQAELRERYESWRDEEEPGGGRQRFGAPKKIGAPPSVGTMIMLFSPSPTFSIASSARQ